MHWILDARNDRTWPAWRQELARRGLPFDLVRVIPYTALTAPNVTPKGNVVCLGNTTGYDNLLRIAKAKGWLPGLWVNHLDARTWNDHLGESMLNHDATYTTLGKLMDVVRSDVFIRPLSETKAFHAGVLTLETLRRDGEKLWRQSSPNLREDLEVLVAPVIHIHEEFRFFVVRGKLVTWSRYRRGEVHNVTGEVPHDVIAFAQTAVNRWGPDDAYVMDVARSERGLKVVEFNCLNSSALYGCNAGAVIDAIEAHS